ncbi:DinB family protein [Corynebacterium senegalense]|uniref:DinB family protein n=1 Tax=Corynebacterium senegalense TaxID=2080750 RepID=UPI000E204862|nr:DinB family protein [Corynebacterium senegalense]
MNTRDTVQDLVERVRFSLRGLPSLSPEALVAHPGGHPNSAAWLLWHTGRELDAQLAALSSSSEVWTAGGFRERFDLGEVGDTIGYGHTPEQARAVRVEDFALLTGYVAAVLDAVSSYASGVDDWDEVVDTYEGEPVTRQVRVTSLLLDALEHLAQAHYVAGMPDLLS